MYKLFYLLVYNIFGNIVLYKNFYQNGTAGKHDRKQKYFYHKSADGNLKCIQTQNTIKMRTDKNSDVRG